MAKTLLDYAPKSGATITTSRAQGLLKYAPTAVTLTQTTQKEERDHNKGGLLGGIGYTLGKFGTGALSVLEGAWDFTAGGIADLLGADEWAEEQFANNITAEWNQGLDKWYNPSKGMQMVGDVASGVGNTVAGIAGAAAVTFFTGGAAAPYAAYIAAGTSGLGAAGGAVSEAYAKTGELGFKEYAYGALSGGTEMALEKFTGVGSKYAAKMFGKETAKTVVKKGLLKNIGADFAGEFFEEAVSEFITPYYQRWTQVDPNAENATIQQIGYAGFIGGLSGALMGGIGTGISTIQSMNRGNEIAKDKNHVDSVVNLSEKFAKYETENNTGEEGYRYIAELVNEYKAQDNGTGVLTLAQKKLLGQMERANVVMSLMPNIQQSKQKILKNADAFAEYINSRKLIDGTTGNPFHFANGAELVKNDGLVTQFAVADALGELLLAPESVYDLVSSNRTDGVMQSDFRNFQKNATAQSKKAINEMFGIDVDGITYEDFIEKIKTTDASVIEDKKGAINARRASKQAIAFANNMGESIKAFTKKSLQTEGTTVYHAKDGTLFAVTKAGTEYYLYVDGQISNKMNIAEIIGAVKKLNGVEQSSSTTQKTAQNQAVASGTQNVSTTKKRGRVTYLNGAKPNGARQKSAVKAIEILSETIGNNWYVFSSYVDENGKRVYKDIDGKVKLAPNGMYNTATGDIYIDLNAGKKGDSLMVFTMAHELTHLMRQWSPKKFKVFADFVIEQYGKKGESVEDLIAKKMNGRELTYDEAYEEVIADSAESMLRDSNALEVISKLKAKDESVWAKIKDFISNMVKKIRAAYAKLNPDSIEGRMVLEMKDVAEKLQTLWTEGLLDAADAYSSAIVQVDTESQSVAPTMFSERTWAESEYVQEREETAKNIAKSLNVSVDVATAYIDDINSVARLVADDRVRLDYEPNLDDKATVLKKNSDYKFSVDMSTLCAKRLLFTGTFDAIQRQLPDTAFDSDDIVRIRAMMEERGYEVACGICYVESTRREIGTITADFINSYKEAQKTGKPIARLNSEGKSVELKKTKEQLETTVDATTDKFYAEKDYTPTLADLNTTDIDLVKKEHPAVYEAYLNFMNARGQAKHKLLETRAEYKGEILKHFKAKSAVDARNNAGGLRLQSFSDFEVPHLIDMMQITMDMARVGLKAQAYTKVPNFADAFGNTGIKINLSLIAKGSGLDSNGNLIFDDKEGINHKEAFRLRDKFSKNVGTILVGKNDAHIVAAMADPRIDYIIPFHKSSWKESLYDALGLTGYADYTDFQNEKYLDADRGKVKNFDPSEYWDYSKTGDENAQIYLEKCREDGRIPKFPQFQGYKGYWKLLIDFKMYDNDGVGSPQEVVRPIFDNATNEKILNEYKGGHRSFPEAKDVVSDFVKEYKDGMKHSDSDFDGFKYSDRVTDVETLEFLENQETLRVYRAMQVIDGKLYPPMAAKVKSSDGKKSLVTPSEIGAWEQAVERPDLIRNGNKFELDKANGSSIQAAYNPYFHTSASPLNDQFTSAYKRENLVVVEGEIPVSELTSGYRAEFAKDTVGETKWHSGVVASKLKGDKARKVYLSRWFKPVRIVPDSEVATRIAETLKGENIDIPYNVVTPSLRVELEKAGVTIKYSERDLASTENPDIRYSDRNPREVTESDVRYILDNIESYDKNSYFPVRINTPKALIDAARKRGDVIENLPVVMQVKKAQQAMSDEAPRSSVERAHGLSSDDMIAILRAMDEPTYIVYQENGRYAEIVRFETEAKKRAIAILEIGENKNAILMNGYDGGIYQILVTAFIPDNYQYIKGILDNKKNIILPIEKKKGSSQRSFGSQVPALLNESPFFEDTITQKSDSVKQNSNISENSQENLKKPDIRYQERKPIKGADKVMTQLPNDKVTLQDVVKGKATAQQLSSQVKISATEKTEGLKIATTNAQAAVERVLKEGGTKDATAMTNYVRAARASALNAIDKDGAQYNLEGNERVGNSLGRILMPVYKANEKDGKTYEDFELYLLHYHNIDRYAVGKPVFNKTTDPIEDHITSEDSKKEVEKLEKQYPWFKEIAKKVWKFNDNNLQLAVDGGLYTQEYVDELREMYPHYVPTYREEYATKAGVLLGRNNIRVNNAKKVAVGSDARILPIDDMMAAQTIQKTNAARMNRLLVQMLENGNNDDFTVISSEDADIDVDTDTEVTFYEDKKKNEYQITFYHNGKQVTAQVSFGVYKGIEAYRGSADTNNNVAIAALAKANTIFKKLVTSWNPFFSFIKNPIRDMQDALLYTKYGTRTFLRNYKRACNEIKNNGKYWQEAKAAGIASSSVYDQEKGIEYKTKDIGAKAVKKYVGEKLESASNAIEMAPRMAEYISAREAGLSVQEALLQAQDVTTNFGRGGTFAKTLNRTVMPFLNPSIQGFSKMWRAYTGEDGAKKWVALIIKSLILGIGVTALNDLLNGDDEEYENLSDYVKEQNYVLALGNGDFIKIPKGRVAGVFGSAYLRGRRYAKGEKDAWEGYLSSVASSVTPVDNITRTIFSPITDITTNTAWHGGKIESQKWNDTEPKNRYDESTSKISIWLGSVFNYSPIKIDYLLEQYTGVVGDLVLPITSTQAESGIVSQNLLANSITNSRWSSEFYDTLEDYTYKKTAGDMQAAGVVKYLNAIKSEISDMQADKQKIQASTTLSDKEKITETRILQATINTLMKETLGNVEYLYNELGKYNLNDEKEFEKAYRDTISVILGEEYALKSYNKNVYEKATTLNKLGIDYATYYDIYFDLQQIESNKDKNGNTVSGSKKAKVISYIMSQDLSLTKKLMLLMAQGYTIADGDVKGLTAKQAKTTVAKYIASLNLTREEKTELAEMLGFTVKNGKIYFN